MKNTIRLLTLLALLSFYSHSAFCQSRLGRTYRVIAYKKGDLSVLSVSNETIIIPTMTMYIPNTFTPNDDGINDTFGITGEAIKEFTMSIYDRWGQLLFQSSDTNKKWDGTFLGKKVATGTYVYKITASGLTGYRQSREGNVNVIL
jgi:gliding motility-associated-like protein